MAGLDAQLPPAVNAAMNPTAGGGLAQASSPPGGAMPPMPMPPSWAGNQAPFGTMGGTAMPQDMMLKLMGALDDPEARRHKFIGSLLQGTRSGSTGESIGNAFSSMGDFELEQMKLRAAYAPMMMREFTMMNQAQQAQFKLREEASKNWQGYIHSAVGSLDPKSTTDLDVNSTIQNLVSQGLVPAPFAQQFMENWQSRLRQGETTGDLLNEIQSLGTTGEKRFDVLHPQFTGTTVPGGSAEVAPGRVGIGPPTQVGATIKGMPALERVSGEGGPDYYIIPAFGGHKGMKLAVTDPRLPQIMAEYQQQGAMVIPPAGPAMPPPGPGTQPPPQPGGPPLQPGTGGAGAVGAAPPPPPPAQTPPAAGIPPAGAPIAPPPVPVPHPAPPPAALAPPPPAAVVPPSAPQHDAFSDAPPKDAFLGPPQPGSGKNAFDLAQKNAEAFQKRFGAVDSAVVGQQEAVSNIRKAMEMSQQFGSGKATPALADAALWFKSIAPKLGMNPDTVENFAQKIAGGDPSAIQTSSKLALQQALTALRASMASADSGAMAGRVTQMEVMKQLENVINSGMDPGAIARLYQFANQHYEVDAAEQRALNQWKAAAGPNMDQVDFTKFGSWWQNKLDERGLKGYQLSPGGIGEHGGPPLNWEWRINPQTNRIEATDQRDARGNPINWATARKKKQPGAQP